uniref:Uncharacterized protein n=1 Tax=Arundo donax TaxID=35708 RepID=A0A0A8Y333_ARUDO
MSINMEELNFLIYLSKQYCSLANLWAF